MRPPCKRKGRINLTHQCSHFPLVFPSRFQIWTLVCIRACLRPELSPVHSHFAFPVGGEEKSWEGGSIPWEEGQIREHNLGTIPGPLWTSWCHHHPGGLKRISLDPFRLNPDGLRPKPEGICSWQAAHAWAEHLGWQHSVPSPRSVDFVFPMEGIVGFSSVAVSGRKCLMRARTPG